MKRILYIYILLMVVAFEGCQRKVNEPEKPVAEERLIGCEELQTGDLLIFELPLDFTLGRGADGKDTAVSPIEAGDEVNHIHVAIVEREGEHLWVIDATLKYNVDRHPLDTALAMFTLKNGKLPRIEVYRLKDNSNAELYVKNAKKYLGRSYDIDFDNEARELYCSELIQRSYVDSGGDTVFDLCEIDFRTDEGEIPTYWRQLFELVGGTVPQGGKGLLPEDITESEEVELVGTFTR